ncbi:MAG: L-threonylcarbamoyladenylate synthase [Burkholderiaceae bacterium]|nr:L-threonylcarbamoyladenylate synthase [Burkholderiaceae bacterium]
MLLDGHDPDAIAKAADALAAGELVAFPTETVYGLGARADDDRAVAGIFAAKGRPVGHPLIVHVADAAAARTFCATWPDLAQRLVAAFWPGPLTVIVPRAEGVAAACAGGQSTIGLRCPSHPVALALLRAAAERGVLGVAAPSANRFGRLSPTQASHVVAELGPDLLVLDGGACEVGIESTIVDCSRDRAVLLRPGTLTRSAIEAVLGRPLENRDAAAPRAPGTLDAHYAPQARVRLMNTALLRSAIDLLTDPASEAPLRLAVYSRLLPPAGTVAIHQAMPARADQTAHELFTVLRHFDDLGAELIWVEEPPSTAEWDGVRDRLVRASAT